MLIKGTEVVTVEVSTEDLFYSMYKLFALEPSMYLKDDGFLYKRGIYQYYSEEYLEICVTKDKRIIAAYNKIKELHNLVEEFNMEGK